MGGRLTLLLGRLWLSVATVMAFAFPAFAEDGKSANYQSNFGYFVVVGVAVVTVIAFATIRGALLGSSWSLSDALSEEADITPFDPSGKPYTGPDGKPLITSEFRGSTSRFIALIGLIGILLLYLGFGLEILLTSGNNEYLPNDDQMKRIAFLLFSGVTMFAPYLVNKFSSVFDWLKPVK
jgi:hypothetical protein